VIWLLSNWHVLAAAAVTGWLGFQLGGWREYRRGWDEGREALAAETKLVFEEKNDGAARADRSMCLCLADPTCRLSDDGWRIDKGD
jgi:hypothetical protein